MNSYTVNPAVAIVLSTLLWGTWWLPLRALHEAGVGSIWANAAGLVLPMLILLPVAYRHRQRLRQYSRVLWLSSFFIAIALALYAEALLRGYVARVLLLFYLTTAWSTLLGRLVLQEPVTVQRVVSIGLSLCGAFVIFGADGGLPIPQHSAEWMGLLSGLCWAIGLVFLHRAPPPVLTDQVFSQFLFVGPIFIIIALLPGAERTLAWPSVELIRAALPWLVAVAFCWTLPLMVLTLYGASRIDPGKVSILLTLEVVIGVITASFWAGEPFGWFEALGAVLIVSAVSTEFFTGLMKKPVAVIEGN